MTLITRGNSDYARRSQSQSQQQKPADFAYAQQQQQFQQQAPAWGQFGGLGFGQPAGMGGWQPVVGIGRDGLPQLMDAREVGKTQEEIERRTREHHEAPHFKKDE